MTQLPITQDSTITESPSTDNQYEENERKGKEAEEKFEKWLDSHKIPYIRFDQTPESFSKIFSGKLKRPDFMVMIPNFGFILIDVKCYAIKQDQKNEKYIGFNENEIKKYIELHKEFGVPIWFAVSNEGINFQSWYWMSINEFDIGEKENYDKKGKKYYKIKTERFREINNYEGLEKLFENKK